MGRYQEFALYLNNLGFDVGGPDLPGHGVSRFTGLSKMIPTIDELNIAQAEILEEVNREQGLGLEKEKWFLASHSMGALLALTSLHQWKSTVIPLPAKMFGVGPPLRIRKPLASIKKMGVDLLEKYLPEFPIPNGEIAPEDISYDIANYGTYRVDPLVHPYMNARQFASWRIKTQQLFAESTQIKTPVFLASGEDDWVCDPATVKDLFQKLECTKRFLLVPNSKHELLFEVGRERMFQAVVSWFN